VPEDLSGGAQGPIIIKKVRKGGHGGHHGGAWKVAYADMVTALLALFIVLWILSQPEEVLKNIASYFRDPVGFREGGVVSLERGGSDPPEPSILEAARAGDPGKGDAEQSASERAAQERRWRLAANQIQSALEQLPVFGKYRDQIEISLTPEGLRISLIESQKSPLFTVGGTTLEPDGRSLLVAIGEQIARLPNHVVIEGHTDSRPFAASARMSNWELSTERSNTARRVLLEAGMHEARVFEVRGFADRQLYNPLDPQDGRNRRVSITLLSDQAYRARKGATETELLIRK
jgi:chemotaxis protein MotB